MNKIMTKKITYLLLLATFASVAVTFNTGCAVVQKRETAGQYTDDKTITARVKSALLADPDVKGTQVNVTTFKGVVQMSGFVDNATQKARAGEIARSVRGVQEVRNDLVLPTGR